MLRGIYTYKRRTEDGNKTLEFQKHDVLMFLDVYPPDDNWLRVADAQGRIGFVPWNHVEIIDDFDPEFSKEFLQRAVTGARQGQLDTLETLESLEEHVIKIEHHALLVRVLHQTIDPKVLEENGSDDQDFDQPDDDQYPVYKGNYSPEGSNNSLLTAKSDRSHSIKTEPANMKSNRGRNSNLDRTPVSGRGNLVSSRPSRSCPLGPNAKVGGSSTNAEYNLDATKNASGDALDARSSTQSIRSKTRIPIRTPNKSSGNEYGRTARQRSEFSTERSQASASSYVSGSGSRRRGDSSNGQKGWDDYGGMTKDVVNIVQESSGLDFRQSEVIVHRIFHHIHQKYHPEMAEKVGSVLKVLERTSSGDNFRDGVEIGSKKLRDIFRFFSDLGKKNLRLNEAFIEDESTLVEKLEELEEELLHVDASVLKALIGSDRYSSIIELVHFYQMETRPYVKSKLLDIFSMLATLDSGGGRSILLKSILPIELSREIFMSEGSPKKLSSIANVLITLMSSGEPMPSTHYEHVGSKFINFVLNYIEEPVVGQGEMADKAKEDLVNLLLAYNLQFSPKDENLIIKVLASRPPGRKFVEDLLYLFERRVDPIRNGGNGPSEPSPHSVLKLVKDMFSSRMTAQHFHTAEMKVLIDSVSKSLTRLGPGDAERTDLLEIICLILRNSSFHYRLSELRELLVGILLEEDPLSIPDQRIVKGMSKEFPQLLMKGKEVHGANSKDIRWMDSATRVRTTIDKIQSKTDNPN